MITYQTSAETTGRTHDVLHDAVVTLTNRGFVIVRRDENFAELNGPGLYSIKQNPLRGASRIHLERQGQQLNLDAELGGVDAMRKFLLWFPLTLGLGLGVIFGVFGGFAFGRQFGVGFGVPWARGWMWLLAAFGGAMLPVAPWLLFSPIMSKVIRARTEQALESLVQNATQSANTA